ncbi:Orn/Lys/Arg decarboxylase N-terminal domain-containing protein [Chitinimonas taiwanensis]|uniref:Arginine decarboxylase n=1 Tax=Chitinimonas taiwanensis DSM 18899 TaxID=1121279 RepID=A0A1K2HRY2_9NEIS|nr:Orn/Lys/Arg decarboxylase N-terminal domain-containing protein [Chitinimonas taiwanensis]SFZ79507.1 arginine decarboxylase [Chitinimonas taiwanensis DSM 18899]
MLESSNKWMKRRVLIVDDDLALSGTTDCRAIRNLLTELAGRNLDVLEAASFADAHSAVVSDAGIHCFFVDWTLGSNDRDSHAQALALLREIRQRNMHVPIFLMAEHALGHSLTVEAMELASEFVWMREDTASFVAGRAEVAIRQYLDELLPPFTQAMIDYARNVHEYSWAAPGHQGGIAFTKTAVGREFFDFFGENLFRVDSGIERGSLGSLLEHSGPIGEAEAYAARVFGAHRSYSVLNGTSGSNRAIMAAVVSDGEFALCDRNCHKSIEQGLVMAGGIPVFLMPTRNRYGIIGPLPPNQLSAAAIRAKLDQHPLRHLAAGDSASYAVITNCTYDGMCIDAARAQDLLAQSVDRIHFDEAWYGYARFNPIYRDRYAMRGDPAEHPADGPTVFATHSTHKLLAALSQASYIHIRNGRQPIEHTRFNESYMLQASTSPLYAIIASNEIGAAMMDGPRGQSLTQEVIEEAVDFRQALARAQREFAAKGDWFFSPWNAPEVYEPETGRMVAFADAPRELLASDPNCWLLKPGEVWHGFDQLEDDWCLLDPIKAGIVCPGMGEDGELLEHGIPADVLTAFLHQRGIIPSRTTDFMVLCLFSMGVTKGKWATLINVLLDFKRQYDRNALLSVELPELVRAHPGRYAKLGLRDLAEQMFAAMKSNRMDQWQSAAFSQLPEPQVLPRRAFQQLMAGKAELLPLHQLAGRTAAVGVIPYPPGIPIVMPGENFGADDGPWLSYMRAMQEWTTLFPGFEKELEGSVLKDGVYHVWCLR